MLSTYTYPRYAYRRPAELDTPGSIQRHPVVVIGAGPVGLAAAIDLAQQGLPVLLLDDDDTVSLGSRGLCYAKRTLEILDRLGCGQALVAVDRDLAIPRCERAGGDIHHHRFRRGPDKPHVVEDLLIAEEIAE